MNAGPSLPASETDIGACLFYLLHRVKQLAGTDFEPSTTSEGLSMLFELRLPLATHSIDLVPHGRTCDCLRGAW